MPTSVVSGGAGFIGSYLCEALLKSGQTVLCIDNLCTGSEGNIAEARKNPKFTFIQADITSHLPDLPRAEYVYNLASPASPKDFTDLSEEIALVNSVGTLNMLKFARDSKARYLEASTSEVYGDPAVSPQTESYWGNVNPNGIRSCYDESKRFAEALTMIYVRKFGVDARIVRIFNTYGPRMRKTDGRVVSNLINQAIGGSPMTVYGNGKQTRSFCYVSDLVSGLIAVMESEGLGGQVYNLGNPDEYSVINLATKIKTMTGSRSEIVFQPLPADDPHERRPDISKVGSAVGWKPGVSLEEGLKRTIEFYRQ